MSHPIKIVEYSNQSPEKNISFYQTSQANENRNIQNSSFHQSINLFPSLTLNKSSNISTDSISLIYNENLMHIKEDKNQIFESFNKINESNNLKSSENSFNNINQEEKNEQKIMEQKEERPYFLPIELEKKNNTIKDLEDMVIDNNNINKEDISNQFINKNIISKDFNNCPNRNEINEYFQNLKEDSDKILNTLKSIYEKYEYLLKTSKDISNNTEINLENNTKINKNLKKDIIIDINEKNIINSKEKNSKEEENSISKKIKSNYIDKGINSKPILNINFHKTKNIYKQKKNEAKEDNNIINNNIIHINKVKNFKRINNRKFNIKARGLRYNILTEEMKKQLLLDAMNMSTIEVAKKYGISTRNVNRWKKKGIQRKKGSGRKFKDPRLEKKILDWYKNQDKETLTSRQFKEKAIELSENKTFRASSGWLTNMKRKYNLNFKKY